MGFIEETINKLKLPEDDFDDFVEEDTNQDEVQENMEKPKFSFHLKKYIDSKRNDYILKKLQKKTDEILFFREDMRKIADLSIIRAALQKRLDEGETLDDILPEAFATVIEAISRVKSGIELTP